MDAYRNFDLTMSSTITDDAIIGRYQARLEDTNSAYRPHLRSALQIIGRARQSQKILDAASDSKTLHDSI